MSPFTPLENRRYKGTLIRNVCNSVRRELEPEDIVYLSGKKQGCKTRAYHSNTLCGHLKLSNTIIKKKYHHALLAGYKRHC